MKLTNNTIFITGATSGIGLGLALAFLKRGNKVIISGRNEAALKELHAKHPELATRVCDVADEASIIATAGWLKQQKVNVFISNAGIFNNIDFTKHNDLADLEKEMHINFTGPVKLISLALPSLRAEKDPAIIIVSSGLAYVPLSMTPLYCATKAALHSFSISLRNQLKKTSVKVIEVLPPAVDTKLTKDLKGSKMPLDTFVEKTIKALGKGKKEIPIGQSAALYYASRISPKFMNYVLNKQYFK